MRPPSVRGLRRVVGGARLPPPRRRQSRARIGVGALDRHSRRARSPTAAARVMCAIGCALSSRLGAWCRDVLAVGRDCEGGSHIFVPPTLAVPILFCTLEGHDATNRPLLYPSVYPVFVLSYGSLTFCASFPLLLRVHVHLCPARCFAQLGVICVFIRRSPSAVEKSDHLVTSCRARAMSPYRWQMLNKTQASFVSPDFGRCRSNHGEHRATSFECCRKLGKLLCRLGHVSPEGVAKRRGGHDRILSGHGSFGLISCKLRQRWP